MLAFSDKYVHVNEPSNMQFGEVCTGQNQAPVLPYDGYIHEATVITEIVAFSGNPTLKFDVRINNESVLWPILKIQPTGVGHMKCIASDLNERPQFGGPLFNAGDKIHVRVSVQGSGSITYRDSICLVDTRTMG